MVTGYVFISTSPGKEQSIYEELKRIPEVVDITPVLGDYDFVVKIEHEDPEKVAMIVLDRIRILDGIINTETVTEAEFQEKEQ